MHFEEVDGNHVTLWAWILEIEETAEWLRICNTKDSRFFKCLSLRRRLRLLISFNAPLRQSPATIS